MLGLTTTSKLAAVKAQLAERDAQLVDAYSEHLNAEARHARQLLVMRVRLNRALRGCDRSRKDLQSTSGMVNFLAGQVLDLMSGRHDKPTDGTQR